MRNSQLRERILTTHPGNGMIAGMEIDYGGKY
jgi:hypothetical protein